MLSAASRLLGTGVRASKLCYSVGKTTVKETAHWYRNVFFKTHVLQEKRPSAIALLGANAAEAGMFAFNAATLNAPGLLLDAVLFMGSKYGYMGWTYRQPLAQGIKVLKENPLARETILKAASLTSKVLGRTSKEYIVHNRPNIAKIVAEQPGHVMDYLQQQAAKQLVHRLNIVT